MPANAAVPAAPARKLRRETSDIQNPSSPEIYNPHKHPFPRGSATDHCAEVRSHGVVAYSAIVIALMPRLIVVLSNTCVKGLVKYTCTPETATHPDVDLFQQPVLRISLTGDVVLHLVVVMFRQLLIDVRVRFRCDRGSYTRFWDRRQHGCIQHRESRPPAAMIAIRHQALQMRLSPSRRAWTYNSIAA